MGKYDVKFYSGEYRKRQANANQDRAICYLEQHFNSTDNSNAGGIEILVADNCSTTSKKWACKLAQNLQEVLNIRLRHSNGVKILSKIDRGYWNIALTAMPAVLSEPLFISNPNEAELLKNNMERIAEATANSIKTIFPDGGLIALSIGHKGKPSKPYDRGAVVVNNEKYEADYAEDVLKLVEKFLEKEV